MNAMGWTSAGMVTVAAVAIGGWHAQRQSTAVLRAELSRIVQQNRELAGVRAEHERLQRERVSPFVLQQLRSDHAALGWLQIEVDALRASVAARRQSAEALIIPESGPPPVPR